MQNQMLNQSSIELLYNYLGLASEIRTALFQDAVV